MKRGSLEKKGAHKKVKKKAWIKIKRLKWHLKYKEKKCYRDSAIRFSQFTNGNPLEGLFTQEWENDIKLYLQKSVVIYLHFLVPFYNLQQNSNKNKPWKLSWVHCKPAHMGDLLQKKKKNYWIKMLTIY